MMLTKPAEIVYTSKESRLAEYKSPNGINFRAKLIGNIEVDELRGKLVAENAMAKLKFEIFKKRQHKTRVNIVLKWDGFYIHLVEGGQELLHGFHLEQISFVWKDSTDDRAVGIIITEPSSVMKFYAYKTEKPAIPLIMALKELFIFRTSDETVEVKEPKPQTTESEIEIVKAAQDLLDLNFNNEKVDPLETFTMDTTNENCSFNWMNFANNYQNGIPTTVSGNQSGILNTNVVSQQTPWSAYPQYPNNITSSPFNMTWPTYSCVESSASNPFHQTNIVEIPVQNSISYQNYNIQPPSILSTSQTQKSNNNQALNLFSDLIPPSYGLDATGILTKHNASNLPKKVSLVEIKKCQIQNEPKMDFTVLDNANSRPVTKPGQGSSTITAPLFQID